MTRLRPRLASLGALSASVVGGAIVTTALSGISVARLALVVALLGSIAAAWRTGLTNVAAVFLVPWYAVAFLAQLRLTSYQTAWSTTTLIVVVAGPLAVALGARLVRARDGEAPASSLPKAERAFAAAVALLAVGIVGLAIKSRLLGTVPLLSPSIDDVRRASYGVVKAWVTFATNCLYLSAWIAIWAAYRGGASRSLRRALKLVALLGIAGTSLNGSRNTFLFAVVVPILFLSCRGISRRRLVQLGAVGILAVVFLGQLLIVRTGQHSADAFGRFFRSEVVARHGPIGQTFYATYITATYPFETLNREVAYFESTRAYGDGRYTSKGFGSFTFGLLPVRNLYDVSTLLSRPFYFNVGTYEGTLFADFGIVGVLLGSLGIGFLVGLSRRRAASGGDYDRLVYAYVLYLLAFCLYENLAAFYPFQPWDLGVLWLAARFIDRARRHRTADPEPAPAAQAALPLPADGFSRW